MVCGYCEGDADDVKKVDGVAVVLKDYDERHGTDRLYILILVAVWVAMTILGFVGKADGNIDMLLRPYDSDGNTCGIDKKENEPFFVFIKATGIPSLLIPAFGNCVKDCPTSKRASTTQNPDDYECVSGIADYSAANFARYLEKNCCDATAGGATCTLPANYEFSSESLCLCALKTPSTSYFNRCVNDLDGTVVNSANPNSSDYMKMFMADMVTSRGVVFGFGFCIALLFAFLYTYLMSMQCMATIIVWSCISGVLALGVFIVTYGQGVHADWELHKDVYSKSQRGWLEAFNYGFMALCIIWFLLMMYMCKSINMAIKCVSMGAKALEEMPLMVLIPLLQISGFILFMVPWVYYCMFVASVGELKIQKYPVPVVTTLGQASSSDISISVGDWKTDDNSRVGAKLGFMFFALLWTMNFIANLGSLVIAHAVSCWYFTKPDDRAEKISSWNLIESYKLIFRYHLGTIAFGSFLIAVIQYARAVAIYIESKSKKECRDKTWVRIVFCCMHVCLCLLETCMKFISKNAYIQCAIHGTDFCTSAKNGFILILNNMKRIGAITITSGLCLTIGKFFVTILATGTSYVFLNVQYENELYSVTGPTIMVAIIAWMTSTMFMDVLAMAIDTIFQCFISDENSNGGEAAFGGDDMKEFVNTHGGIKEKDDGGCCGDDSGSVEETQMTNQK